MHISLSSVCKHTNKIQWYKAQHFQLVVKGGGEIVGEILGGVKGNFGYNEISESPIFWTTNCMIGISTNCGIGK